LTSPRRALVKGALVVALGVCGWFAAAMPPFGIESSAVTFSVAATVLAMSAVLAHRSSPALDWRVREASFGQSPDRAPTPDRAAARLPARLPAEAIRDTSMRLSGTIAWMLAALVFVAVELWELFHAPRSTYPTLSSLANEVLGPGHRVVRAVAFMCWGACGLIVPSRPSRRA
jgi:hypothetical protein